MIVADITEGDVLARLFVPHSREILKQIWGSSYFPPCTVLPPQCHQKCQHLTRGNGEVIIVLNRCKPLDIFHY